VIIAVRRSEVHWYTVTDGKREREIERGREAWRERVGKHASEAHLAS
jgi:hypothetical protein